MSETRVLIADGEQNARAALSRALEGMELAIECAVNGQECLERVAQGGHQLALLDPHLPDMAGLEVLKRIREKRPELPVVIVTAHGSVESAVEAMRMGAADFIEKPFAPREIQEVVQKVLARERLTEDQPLDYDSRVELARRSIGRRALEEAARHLRQAIELDSGRAEAHDLLGLLHLLRGDLMTAIDAERAALDREREKS